MSESIVKEIVSWKGTRQGGILMSIVEDCSFEEACACLKEKYEGDKALFEGSPLSLDLGWREVSEQDLDRLLRHFEEWKINLLGVISSSLNTRLRCEKRGLKVIIGRLGLADHHGSKRPARAARKSPAPVPAVEKRPVVEKQPAAKKNPVSTNLKGADTKTFKRTVRSGQSVEFPGNVVIMGDVNPGGSVEAGGDVIILGSLRGKAKAGIDENREDPTITAFRFMPSEIQIKDVTLNIFDGRVLRSKQPISARIKNNKIDFTIYR